MAQHQASYGLREQQDLARQVASLLSTAASAQLAGPPCEEWLADHPDVLNDTPCNPEHLHPRYPDHLVP
eukprot:6861765-Heterocapsa_arctica.AAC.1